MRRCSEERLASKRREGQEHNMDTDIMGKLLSIVPVLIIGFLLVFFARGGKPGKHGDE